jgi:hypothetical protein
MITGLSYKSGKKRPIKRAKRGYLWVSIKGILQPRKIRVFHFNTYFKDNIILLQSNLILFYTTMKAKFTINRNLLITITTIFNLHLCQLLIMNNFGWIGI